MPPSREDRFETIDGTLCAGPELPGRPTARTLELNFDNAFVRRFRANGFTAASG